MSITLGSRVKAPTYSLPPHLAQVYRKEIQLPTLTWKQAGLLMNSTRNYHVKANLTLICYNEIHFVPTYLYLLRNRNTPGKVLAWRKHCSHAGSKPCQRSSSASSRQQEPLAQHSRRKTCSSAVPRQGHPCTKRSGSSSGMLGGARPVPVHVGVRRGGTLRGDNALLGCGGCQRHREALGGQRGKVLSPVGFAQWEIIAVTQTVAGRVIFFF